MARMLTGVHGRTVFQVLKNLMVRGKCLARMERCSGGASQHY